MANQPTKYKKFVATAATATLVASAIVPVASAASFNDVNVGDSHADAIQALSEQGIINGYASDNTFRPNLTLTRGQVVKMLGKWVEAQGFEVPTDWNTTQRFDDLSVDAADQELVKYAALVFDTEVFKGAVGNLNAGGDITRQNMALVLDRAYKAVFGQSLVEEAAAATDVTVADLADAREETQEAIQALAKLGITNQTNFRPNDSVTRGQFASFLYRTIELDGGETTTPDQGEVAIVSTKATKVNELTIEFNKAVDTNAAAFEVKQGNTVIKVSDVKWNEAGTVATVEVDHKFVAATYNLSVTGVSKEALTASVTTTREVATEMKFNSDKLVLTGVEKEFGGKDYQEARITFEVYNQYGEIITDTISTGALEADLKGIGAEDDETQYNVRNGLLVFWVDEDEDEGETGSIKLTYEQGDVELETTQEVTLSDEIEPGQVEIKGVHSDAGYDFTSANVEKALSASERSEWTEEFVVLFTLKDQYGVEINAEDASNSTSGDVALLESVQDGLRLSTSDDDIFELDEDEITTKVVDGKYYFAAKMRFTFDGELLEETGENTVTFRSTATGEEATSKITLASSERIQAVELSYPTGVIAGDEDVYVPVKAVDGDGNTVVDASLLNSLVNKDELIVNIDGKERGEANGFNFYFVEKDGATFLKFKTKPAVEMNSAGKNEEYELDIEIEVEKTGEESEITLDVQPDAYPRSLVKVSAETALYLNDVATGDTITLALEQGDFTIEDQYGRQYDDGLAGFAEDFKIEASLNGGTNFAVNGTIGSFDDEIVLSANKKGSSNIEFKLSGTIVDEDGDNEPINDKLSVTFRTVDEDDFVSYKVDSKEFVYGYKDSYADPVVTKSPNSKVEVFGVLGNGQEIQLPASAFRLATGNYLLPDNRTTGDASYIFVNAEGLGQLENISGTNQLETGFNVIINQSGEVVQTAVKISDAPSKVKSIKLEDTLSAADKALETLSFDLDSTDYNVGAASTITYAELINALGEEVKFEIKDQYGYSFVDSSDVTDLLAAELKVTQTQVDPVRDVSRPIITLSEISNDDTNVRSNGSSQVELQNVAQGDSFTLTLTINGVSKSVKVFAE